MNSSKRWKLWCCAVMGIMLWSAGLYKMDGRLTYIERSRINEESVQSIAVTDHETVLEQEFSMPYELFWGVEIKIGTYGRNNNSFWKVKLKETENGRNVYAWDCNASQISDGEYYKFNVKSPVHVKQGQQRGACAWRVRENLHAHWRKRQEQPVCICSLCICFRETIWELSPMSVTIYGAVC